MLIPDKRVWDPLASYTRKVPTAEATISQRLVVSVLSLTEIFVCIYIYL